MTYSTNSKTNILTILTFHYFQPFVRPKIGITIKTIESYEQPMGKIILGNYYRSEQIWPKNNML